MEKPKIMIEVTEELIAGIMSSDCFIRKLEQHFEVDLFDGPKNPGSIVIESVAADPNARDILSNYYCQMVDNCTTRSTGQAAKDFLTALKNINP